MLAIAFFIAAYPVFRAPVAPSRPTDVSPGEGLAELLARRDATYATLKELDLDLEMSKLSAVDHRVLRDRYRTEAVAILQELDAHQAEAHVQVAEEREPEQDIERDIAARRPRQRDPAHCPGCGAIFEPGDRFCRHCGATLEKEGI
jgi:hypothetical protein